MKISEFLSENFHFLVVKFSIYLNKLVFVMMRWSVIFCIHPSTSDSLLEDCLVTSDRISVWNE